MSNSKIVKNASWIIVCRIIQSFLSLIIGMISARYLGPSNYGLISYASSVVAFAVPIVQLGQRNTLVEEIVSNPEREGKTMGTAIAMTVASSFLGIMGIWAFTSIANAGETDTILVCMLHSIGLIFQMTEMIQYWYQAKLLSKYTSIVSLIAYVLVAAYKIYILASQKSIYWFSVTTAFDYLIISVILIVWYNRLSDQKLGFSFSLVPILFAKSKYYIISGMMVTIFSQTDKIMIKMMVGDTANGYYSVAITCASMAGFVFTAIIDSFRPVIFSSKKQSHHSFEKNMTRLYSIIIYMGMAQSIFLTIFAPLLVPVIYGEKYLPAIAILQIITWYSSFSYMGSIRNIWILAEGQQKYMWIINLTGAMLNVIVNAMLIPIWGAAGAAFTSVMTQLFTNFVLCFIISPIRPTGHLILKSLNPKIIIDMIPRKGSKI